MENQNTVFGTKIEVCDVLICEDIWNNEYRGGEDWMKPASYTVDPVEAITRHNVSGGPLFVLNGSPFWLGKIQRSCIG